MCGGAVAWLDLNIAVVINQQVIEEGILPPPSPAPPRQHWYDPF